MKILQFAPYCSPYIGGQESYIYNLSKYLAKRGHDVHILASNYPITKNIEKIDNITIERINVKIRILRNPLTLGFLKIKSRYKNFDIIHIHNEHSFSSMTAAYYKRRYNFPLILTNHGILRFDNFIFDIFEKIYSRTIGKKIFKLVDRIITLSPADKHYVSSFDINPNKIIIIPNAIDPSRFESHNISDKTRFITKYKLEGKQIVLYTGQIIRRKGIVYLLKSIKLIKMRSTENNTIFVIIGDGNFLKKAQKIAKDLKIHDSVIFTGHVDWNELIQAYKSASVYVLPSLSEGLPTTILEAMFLGVPVISTNIPGVEDHFKNYAVLVPPKNFEALANAIMNLLHDKKLAQKLALEGKKLVKTKYSWEMIVKEYESVYKEMILQRN